MRKFTLSLLVILLSVFIAGPNAFGQAKHTKTTDIRTVQAPVIQKTTPSGPTDTDMYSCDFEDIDDWSMDFTPWMAVDNDLLPTYGMTGTTWPGSGDPQAFICFNPATTDPPLTDDDEIQPHSGAKFGACLAAVPDGSNVNDDWFISDMVTIGAGASFNFWAKSYTDQYGLERFNVAVSTTTPDPGEFTVISGATYLEAPIVWTEYNFDLSMYAGQDAYVAIQCVTSDAFVFMIDDLVITSGGGGTGYCDDFESYTAGDFLCTQSDEWTTWDDNPGGDYDAYITDVMAQSGVNSVDIDLGVLESDIVTDLGQMTTGKWSISMEVYVPADGVSGAYWNIMQDMELFGAANEWGFQIYYRSDGTGYMQDADFNEYEFVYIPGEWTMTEVVIDLDNAIAKLYVDGTMYSEWQWDIAGPNMLGAVDIYAASDGNDVPKWYMDSFCFQEVTAPQPTSCEDFDSYAVGDYVGVVVDGWTTWGGAIGTAEDALITDVVANSDPNSFIIEGTTDLLQLFADENITSGKYSYSNMLYVPDGFVGYYNLQKDVIPGEEWAFQVVFDSDGNATVDAGAAAAVVFPFTFDEWHYNELIIDLDADYAEYWFNGELMIAWAWSLGTFGTPGAMTLGGANYYASTEGLTDPMAYFDDVCFEEFVVPANCDDFDEYVAGDFLGTQSPDWTTWDDNPGGDYDAYITDEMSETAPNSIGIDLAVLESDIVYDLGQKTTGAWEITCDVYVPDGGYGGYYNVMQDMELFGAANEWGFQIYFKSDGTGYMYDADFTMFEFTYNIGEWNHSAVYVDLDNDIAQYVINDEIIATWQWTIAGPLMLGAVDVYAAADGNDDPKMYIDNFCYDMTSINVSIEDPIAEASVTANIYPNPARDQITIESESIIDEVRIYNNMGQLVYSGEFNNDQIMVNTSNFLTGMYIVQVRSGEALEVRKLIIE